MAINDSWLQGGAVNLPSYGPSDHWRDDYRRAMARMAPPNYFDPASRLVSMIGMRLRIQEGARIPCDFITAHEAGDKVFVFVVHNGQPLVIEDDKDLFPSDKLVTQLRLLQR